jgi:hypothetical protein
MAEKKQKLELLVNQAPVTLELLSDPVVGESSYGEYCLLNVKKPSGEEFSLFAPTELLDQMKALHKGNKIEVAKLAEKNGNKLVTKYDLKLISNGNGKKASDTENNTVARDNYFDIMLASYLDALRIQENLNGMVDVNKIAVCLFIARSKVNANGLGG